MKKLYTLLTAAAVTLSAAAITIEGSNFQLRNASTLKKEVTRPTATLKAATPVTKITSTTTMRKADANESIEGNWIFTLGDYYFESSSNSAVEAPFTATLDGTTVIFASADDQYFPIIATFNEAEGKITISDNYFGGFDQEDGSVAYCKQRPYVYNYTTRGFDFQTIEATFNASKGELTFGDENGVAWVAYADEACTQQVGYFDIEDVVHAVKSELEPEPEITWTSLGTGMLLDNILTPSFTGNNSTSAYEVEVFCDANATSTYLVKNVWKQFFESQGFNGAAAELQINAADPANAQVPMASTLINGGDDGIYVLFSDSWYNDNYGDGAATTEDAVRITLTRDGDNVTITFPAKSMLMLASATGNIYYACSAKTPAASTLTFTQKDNGGIDSVIAGSDADAPVEYFNLQGVRVANPAAGQLVIKRQGTTVSKLIAR